jgi:hypothetical protein
VRVLVEPTQGTLGNEALNKSMGAKVKVKKKNERHTIYDGNRGCKSDTEEFVKV